MTDRLDLSAVNLYVGNEPARDDAPTDCDYCGDPILYGVTCYAVPTGEVDEGRPVVRIVCETCRTPTERTALGIPEGLNL